MTPEAPKSSRLKINGIEVRIAYNAVDICGTVISKWSFPYYIYLWAQPDFYGQMQYTVFLHKTKKVFPALWQFLDRRFSFTMSKSILSHQKGRVLWIGCKEKDFNITITIGFTTSYFFFIKWYATAGLDWSKITIKREIHLLFCCEHKEKIQFLYTLNPIFLKTLRVDLLNAIYC